MSQAQAQSEFSEDPNNDPFSRDPLETYQNDLNRQILRQLTNSLTQDLFGEDGTLNEGSFEVGDFQIGVPMKVTSIWLQTPHDEFEERRFASAVGTHETEFVAGGG